MSNQFDRNESKLAARMADGHRMRKGHELKGVWVYEMPGYKTLQRTCCARPAPISDTLAASADAINRVERAMGLS